MTIKYFSMFSGIGGFEVGMHNSKYKDELECVGFSEVNNYAISIYSRWFPNHRNYGDATTIDTSELDDFSLLIGGFPCQSFSIAGEQKGFNDTRGTLFFEIARVLQDKKPQYFLLENVKGLLSNNKGKTFKKILGICDELGYDVSWETHNSKNYGVPQNRERLFLKGYFRERCGDEILLAQRKGKKVDELKLNQMNNQHKRSFGDRVYNPTGLARTLCGETGDKTGLYGFDNLTVRRLTPLECERLQGFNDEYTKYGKDGELISDTQRYRCLGNAVTTNVIEYIFNNWDLNVKEKS